MREIPLQTEIFFINVNFSFKKVISTLFFRTPPLSVVSQNKSAQNNRSALEAYFEVAYSPTLHTLLKPGLPATAFRRKKKKVLV